MGMGWGFGRQGRERTKREDEGRIKLHDESLDWVIRC
jgi:hypothetical protein